MVISWLADNSALGTMSILPWGDDFALEYDIVEIPGQSIYLMLPQIGCGSQEAGMIAIQRRIADR